MNGPAQRETPFSRFLTAVTAAIVVSILIAAALMPPFDTQKALVHRPLPVTSSTYPLGSPPAPLEPEWEWARNVTIAYTWVNGSDQTNRRLRAQYGGAYAVGSDRDRDNDDLLYSLRTLAINMPWHTGRIVVISPSPPSFLRLAHPPINAKGERVEHSSPAGETGLDDPLGRVDWIDQDRLIPAWAQPTFSSNVVEAYLYRLPPPRKGSHLPDSEWIIHSNDDYTFPSQLHPKDFFTLGRPGLSALAWAHDGAKGRGYGHGVRQYLEMSQISRPPTYDEMVPEYNIWLFSTLNTLAAIERVYGPADNLAFPPHFVKHAPFVYSRTALAGAAQRFSHDRNVTSLHKFRHHEDTITPLLVHAYTALEGSLPSSQRPSRHLDHPPLTFEVVSDAEITPATLLEKWTANEQEDGAIASEVKQRIASGKLKFLALNDEIGWGEIADNMAGSLKTFYRNLYGDRKSPFEL